MKTTKLLLMSLLLIGLSFADNMGPDDLYAKGLEALESSDWDSAENLFKSSLDLDAGFAPAMIQLAKISVRNGDMDQTKNYIRQAIEADPENEEYRNEYDQLNEINKFMSQGAREIDAGEFENAFTSFSQVYEKYPYMTEAIYSLGVVKMREGDFDAAIEYFNKALIVNKNHEKAQKALKSVAGNMFNEGNNFYRRRDYNNALKYYKKVIEIDNSLYQAYFKLGQVETRLKNKRGAIKAFAKSVEVKPDFYQGWYMLGVTKRSDGDDQGSLKAFQKATDINPNYAKAYYAMGDIYYRTNNFEKAKSYCQLAIQADGSYAKPYITLANINIDNKEYDEALVNLDLATTLNRKDSKAWLKIAQVQNILKNCEEAKRAARKSLDLSNKSGEAWVELGVAEYCGGSGNKTAALNALEKARGDRIWKTYAEHEIDKIRNPHRYQN
ncbi:MAG: tetratricopeptide repeat protein [Planctomycetia bacterium]|nr:tetratricopeptide repeat protein [Planctomycetia bacterium]